MVWLAWHMVREQRKQPGAQVSHVSMQPPLFLWGFLLAVVLKSTGVLSIPLEIALVDLSQLLMATGLAALGVGTRWLDLRCLPTPRGLMCGGRAVQRWLQLGA